MDGEWSNMEPLAVHKMDLGGVRVITFIKFDKIYDMSYKFYYFI